jgi:transposase
LENSNPHKTSGIRLFFQDEAVFGRISEFCGCWCAKGTRPVIHKQMVREYRTVFGAVEPLTGELFYMIEPQKPKPDKRKIGRPKKGARVKKPKPKPKGEKSRHMNEFMKALTEAYPNDHIVLVCDNAWWHKSKYTQTPDRITLLFIPPYTPEMNPIEQIWREIRTAGFANKYFKTIQDVEANIHSTISTLSAKTIMSITQRDWILNCVKSNVG